MVISGLDGDLGLDGIQGQLGQSVVVAAEVSEIEAEVWASLFITTTPCTRPRWAK